MKSIYKDKQRRAVNTKEEIKFSSFSSLEALLDSPASFNGGQLHDLSKTVYFLTFLKGKDHTITLGTDEPTNIATLESVEVYTLDLPGHLTLKIEKQAEDGDILFYKK